MANSTTNLPTITSTQSAKETTANQIDDYESPSSFFARNATSAALTWNYFGANYMLDGVPSQIANGTINSLPPNIAADGIYLQAARVSATTKAIAGISKAANASLNVTAHGYSVHQTLYISDAVAGMVEIKQFFCRVVSVTDANNFTINVNSTAFTTWSSGGTVAPAGGNTGVLTVGKGAEWHPDARRLYRLTTGASTVSSYTDYRGAEWYGPGVLNKAMSDADTRLTAEEQFADIWKFTGTITAQRNIIVGDLTSVPFVAWNATTGGLGLNFKTAAGSGVVVQVGQRALLYADGTNVVPASQHQLTQVIAFSTSITIDAEAGGRVLIGALTNNTTNNAPTNPTKGKILTFAFIQDATGGRTITWNAVFKKAADGAGTANQKGATQFVYDGTDWIQTGGPLVFF